MPCNPKELARLAELSAQGKAGESSVTQIRQDPTVSQAHAAEAHKRMGVLAFARTQRGAMGPEFSARVLNPLSRGVTSNMNELTGYSKEINDAVKGAFGFKGLKRYSWINDEQDRLISRAVRQMDETGTFHGPDNSLPPEVVQAGKGFTQLYTRLGKIAGIRKATWDEFRDIMEEQGKGGILYDSQNVSPRMEALRERFTPEEAKFFSEYERRGIVQNPEPLATSAMRDFLETFIRVNRTRPLLDQLEKDHVNDFFQVKHIRVGDRLVTDVNDSLGYGMWHNLKNHVLGVPVELDQHLVYSMNKLITAFGVKPATTKGLYKTSSMMSNLFYGGVLGAPGLGARPASLVRHMFRIVPTFSEFGAYDTLAGLKVASTPGSWEAAIKRGLISAPLEGIHEQLDMAGKIGKGVSELTKDFLKVFDASDRYIRVATVGAADSRFERAMAKGIDSLKGRKEIRDVVIPLVKQGQISRARDEFASDALNQLQFGYGKVNRPQMARGVIGQAANMLMAYPFNLAEMYAQFGQRAWRARPARFGGTEPISEALPLIRQVGIVSAGMMAGSQLLNTDLSSVFLHGALPSAMSVPSAAMHGYQAGRTNVNWAVGNVFMTGESDYAKRERQDAVKSFSRDMASFIPGGVFAGEVAKFIDDPTMANFLKHSGFQPLASEANEQRRTAAAEALKQRRFDRDIKVKGIDVSE